MEKMKLYTHEEMLDRVVGEKGKESDAGATWRTDGCPVSAL